MRTALVTGATGYVGSHLVPTLLRAGWRVRACGRRNRPAWLPPEVAYDRVDLTLAAPPMEGVTHVFHLAGTSSTFGSPEEVERSNVIGTRTVAAAAAAAGVERFVHVSSTAVYGERVPLPLPVTEGTTPHPSRGYGLAKLLAEEEVLRQAERGLAVTILRPTTVYGPGCVKLLASAVLDAAIERYAGLRRLEIPREPVRLRLVHVEDLVRACLVLAEAPAAAGEIFNVTSGTYPTSLEVAGAIAEALGMQPCPTDGPAGLGPEERRRIRARMLAEAGMVPAIVFTEERLRFLIRPNPNTELSIAKLTRAGAGPRRTDPLRDVAELVTWFLERRWIV